MKKIVFLVVLSLGLGLTNIHAQRAFGGIKIDATMSNFILKDTDDMQSKLGFGVSVGGYTKIMFGEGFALQPELLLHYKTSEREFKLSGLKTDYQYFGLEIPIYAVGQKNIGNGKGFVGIGPYAGFGIDARYKAEGKPDEVLYGMNDVNLYKEHSGQKAELQRWDFGAGVMLGYEFGSRLQIIATYKMGFIDAINVGKDSGSILNQAISVGFGYRF